MKNTFFTALLLFVAIPLLVLCYLSVVTAWSYPQLWDAQFTLAHWRNLLGAEDKLAVGLGLSLLIAGSLSVAATAFGFWVSKALLLRMRAYKWLQLAFYPYLIAPVIFGGMLQFYFLRWGLTGTVVGVMVALALFVFPYSVLLLSTFWSEQVRLTAFQAQTLGATSAQLNRQVLLPMARPWLMLSLVQCFLIAWMEYGITKVVGLGKVATLPVQAMQYVQEANPHKAALAALLMIAPVVCLVPAVYFLLFKKTRQ